MFKKNLLKSGAVLLAAITLGMGAWEVNTIDNSNVPELVSFVDLDDQISINEDEVPLAAAPKTTTKTKTKVTKKTITQSKKASKTITYKGKPTVVKSPTVTKNTSTEITKIYKTTTTVVEKRYTKGSNKVVQVTTVTTKTTTTVTKKAGAATNAGVTSANDGNIALEKIAPALDTRVKKAYNELHFDITINSKASYAGLFDAKKQNITLREASDTVYHELGHFVAFIAGNVDTKSAFQTIYQKEKNSFTGSRKAYAIQNASEFFAECYREYTLNPATLKKTCPQTYAAIVSALGKITDSQIAQAKQFYGSIWTK